VGCRLKPRRDPLGDAVCATRSPMHSGTPRIADICENAGCSANEAARRALQF